VIAHERVLPLENESNFLPFKGSEPTVPPIPFAEGVEAGMGLIAERTHPHPVPLLEGEGGLYQGGQ